MSTDQLKGGGVNVKVMAFDQPGDHVAQADHHQLSKKPPVPIMRGTSRRKTWKQPQPDTSPVSLRKSRSEVMSKSLVTVGDGKAASTSTSPRNLRKVKSTPPRSGVISKLDSKESGIQTQQSASNDTVGVAAEFEKIKNDSNGSDSDDECQEKKLITSNVDTNQECIDELEHEEEEEHGQDEVDEKPVKEDEIEIKEVTVPDKNLSDTLVQDCNNDDTEDAKVCHTFDKKAVQSALVVKQPPRYVKRSAFYLDFNKSDHKFLTKPSINIVHKPGSKFTRPNPSSATPAATSIPQPHEFKRHPDSGDRLQSLVDLVMWRDISRSTFVFGTGIFMIISSSYTQDLNISFVSVASYLGLSYLALIFLFRSILHRGVIHVDNDNVFGEGEAIWIVKLVLPYVNEFFLTLRSLFSGDPATTMKLAVFLFFLAKCGSSITIWKMAKLGFIGVFTVPKFVALYSLQLKTQCKFWVERFRDAWDTCSHKKIIAGIIFSLIWNLCSVVARIWALFMVAVAFRYYQQLMADEEGWEGDVDAPLKEQCGAVGVTKIDSFKEMKGI